jgi:hypothetical protein
MPQKLLTFQWRDARLLVCHKITIIQMQKKRTDIQMPDIQMPDIQMPDIQMPDIQMPDIQMPDIQMQKRETLSARTVKQR